MTLLMHEVGCGAATN